MYCKTLISLGICPLKSGLSKRRDIWCFSFHFDFPYLEAFAPDWFCFLHLCSFLKRIEAIIQGYLIRKPLCLNAISLAFRFYCPGIEVAIFLSFSMDQFSFYKTFDRMICNTICGASSLFSKSPDVIGRFLFIATAFYLLISGFQNKMVFRDRNFFISSLF